jgi:methylamine dehydrogenase heavy chain
MIQPIRRALWEESGSFLKKRTKKLLPNGARSIGRDRSQNNQKFFASFFQKRSPSFPRWLLATAAVLGLAAASPAFPPPPALEPETSDVAKLSHLPAHWLLVQTLPSGMTIFDADHGKILAGLPSDFAANTVIAPDLKHFYVAETIWTRRTRGDRQDMLTTYDAETLDLVHETALPPRALTVFKPQDLALSASGRLAYVFNLAPATSVTVVDMAGNTPPRKIDTPGCGLIFPFQDAGFASLCGDGSLLTVVLNGAAVPKLTHQPLFDAAHDPVFESSLVDAATGHAAFISFTGKVFPVTLGPAPVIGAPWSLQAAAGQPQAGVGVQELAWRPGGYQVAAWHKASGRLFVLMHPGTFWTQKQAGTEVWVFDMAAKQLLRRIPLKIPAKGVAISQDASPLLYTTNGDGDLAVINPDTGEEVKTAKFDGGGPLLIVAGQ